MNFSAQISAIRWLCILAICVLPLGNPVFAAPGVGDLAPDFELVGSDGATHRLSDYRGQYVVLAWFPKALTKG